MDENGYDEKRQVEEGPDRRRGTIVSIENGVGLNASGHKDQLQRHYGLLALCGLALNIDNAWIALGGSVTIAIGELPADIISWNHGLIAI